MNLKNTLIDSCKIKRSILINVNKFKLINRVFIIKTASFSIK